MSVVETSLRKNATILEAYRKRAIKNAQDGLLDFTLYTYPRYESGWFNELLCAELDHFLLEVDMRQRTRLCLRGPGCRRFPALRH